PQLARIGVLRRPYRDDESPTASTDPIPVELEVAVQAGRVHFIDNSPCPWSSTVLRSQLSDRGADVRSAFDPLVLDYIDKYELYE
ncbi:MAG: hypothetical protein K8J08_14285, partial [Thermoanaerobaculia bacterium]|nr:hypothetical protein [Thermoanaerobaculia bacterium]